MDIEKVVKEAEIRMSVEESMKQNLTSRFESLSKFIDSLSNDEDIAITYKKNVIKEGLNDILEEAIELIGT